MKIIKFTRIFLIIALLISTLNTQLSAQRVGISDDPLFEPDASAILHLEGEGLGLLIPTMTQAQRPATPANGLIIYQTDNDPGFYYWDASVPAWIKMGVDLSNNSWFLGGNTITDPNTQYLGTNTAQPIILRTDQIERMRISAAGNVGIGTNTPDASAILDLTSNSQGLLISRMTEAQRDGIATPATGLMVFVTDDGYFYYNQGTPAVPEWVRMIAGSVTINLATDVTGILPVANGGLGSSGLTGVVSGNGTVYQGLTSTAGQMTYWNATNTIAGTNNMTWDAGNSTLNINGTVNSTNTITNNILYNPLNTAPLSPSEGTVYYDNVTNQLLLYNGTTWENISGSDPNAWSILGNSGTNPASNFIGTIDLQDFVIRTNNTERVRISSDGHFGLRGDGTNAREMRLFQGNNNFYTAFRAQNQLASVTYTLPAADGTTGQVLSTDGSGLLSWETVAAGGGSNWTLSGSNLYPNQNWWRVSWGGGTASEYRATAWGSGTQATANLSTAWGDGTTASGNTSTTWGNGTTASANLTTAWGSGSSATTNLATAWGQNNTASGDNSTAFGSGTQASGQFATSFGQNTVANAQFSTAFGSGSQATANYATAFGLNALASNEYATAWGDNTTASGQRSTAWGDETVASALLTTAWGNLTTASGEMSTAFGTNTTASGRLSTALGNNTTAYSGMEFVLGQWNTTYSPSDTWGFNSNDRLFVLGNGTATDSRSDALRVFKSGNMDLFGNFSLRPRNSTATELRLFTQTGDNYTGFKASSVDTATVTYTLPSAKPDIETGVLVSNDDGEMRWEAPSFFGGNTVNTYITPINQDYIASIDDLLIVISTAERRVLLPKASDVPGKVYYIIISPDVGNSNGYVDSYSTDKIATGNFIDTAILKFGNGNQDMSGGLFVSDGNDTWWVITSRRTNN